MNSSVCRRRPTCVARRDHHGTARGLSHWPPDPYADNFCVPRTAVDGGQLSYGVDTVEQFRQAAGYVDRILKGAKPAELPVQLPTKFELIINLKTAKALGLDIPFQLQQRADELIE